MNITVTASEASTSVTLSVYTSPTIWLTSTNTMSPNFCSREDLQSNGPALTSLYAQLDPIASAKILLTHTLSPSLDWSWKHQIWIMYFPTHGAK